MPRTAAKQKGTGYVLSACGAVCARAQHVMLAAGVLCSLQPCVCVLRRRTRGIAPLTSVDDLTSVDQLAALLPVGQLSKRELEAIQKSMRLQLLLLSLKELGAIQKSMRLVSHTWGRVEVCFCAVHYTCPWGSRCPAWRKWGQGP